MSHEVVEFLEENGWGGGGANKLSIIHALQTPPADQDLDRVGLQRDSIQLKAFTCNNVGVVDQN